MLDQSCSQLVMVQPRIGWAGSTAGLVRTHDGALTWTRVNTPETVEVFTAIGPNRLWFAAYSRHNGITNEITLWRTSDAGKTWRSAVIRLHGQAVYFAYPVLDFVNARAGWLSLMAWGIDGAGLNALFRTTDSGATWKQLAPPASLNSLLGFQTAQRGFASDVNAAGGMDFAHFPYGTSDGGASWFHETVAPPAGYQAALVAAWPAGFSGSSSAVIPVELISETGGTHRLFTTYRTVDNGKTWTHGALVGGHDDEDYQAYFFDAAHGWYTHYNPGRHTYIMYRSVDGGQHWTKLGPRFMDAGFEFVNPTVGFMLDSSLGGVWKTTNGGKAWALFFPRIPS